MRQLNTGDNDSSDGAWALPSALHFSTRADLWRIRAGEVLPRLHRRLQPGEVTLDLFCGNGEFVGSPILILNCLSYWAGIREQQGPSSGMCSIRLRA